MSSDDAELIAEVERRVANDDGRRYTLAEVEYEFDHDAWAKDPCDCGHSRHQHEGGKGACRRTRLQRVPPADLPPAAETENPFDWPSNWPLPSTWPEAEVPCCSGFQDEGTARAEEPPW